MIKTRAILLFTLILMTASSRVALTRPPAQSNPKKLTVTLVRWPYT